MRVLGIDPGIARLGWGVIDEEQGKQKAVAFGCLTTKKNEAEENRLYFLFESLKKIIQKYQPTTIVVEDLFFAANAKTALRVGQAKGVVLLLAALQKIPLKVYTPLKIKTAIVGYGRAEKHQVQQMVKNYLKLDKVPQPDDTADALAVGLTYCFLRKFEEKTE